MSDNRQGNYQPLLTTGLARALGATLMTVVGSNDATAYPSGAVSYGSNPIVSVGGSISSGDVISPITAPTGSDLIISDVFISSSNYLYYESYMCGMTLKFEDTSGNTLAQFRVGGGSGNGVDVAQSMISGVRLPAGETLTITASTPSGFLGCHSSDYTLAGYYAEP